MFEKDFQKIDRSVLEKGVELLRPIADAPAHADNLVG
jgi:hypothetical protein